MAIKLDVNRVAGLNGMTFAIARRLLQVYPTAEDLRHVTMVALVNQIEDMSFGAASAVISYALTLRQTAEVDFASAVEELRFENSLDELFTEALNLWLIRGLEKVPGRVVLLGQNEPALVTVRIPEPGRFCFAVRCEDAEFYMDVYGVQELESALSAMGVPYARLSAWGVIQRLKLYAERYRSSA